MNETKNAETIEDAIVSARSEGTKFAIMVQCNRKGEINANFRVEHDSGELSDMDIKRVAAVSYELRDFVEELKKILKSESLLVSGCRRIVARQGFLS